MKIFRLIGAVLLILAGVVGLLLPLAPGVPLILAGLYLLNPTWTKQKYEEIRDKIKSKFFKD